ncbi:MAG: P1 family peptidase [Anaerolineae bacterium]
MARYPGSICDVPGIRVGHAADGEALTGCTVILCPPEGAVGGGIVRGYAPGTRETALLQPGMLVGRVHALLLTGGSAYGLAAADGVMRWLEEQGIGYDTGAARVPIVPGAVLFDLGLGSATVRPDAAMGYAAASDAHSGAVEQGNVGAGLGATVGKLAGMACATKGGLGMASLRQGDVIVSAIVAVNALGNVVDPEMGNIVAGARSTIPGQWVDVLDPAIYARAATAGNTVIGALATNARLEVAGANRLAYSGHDGLARVIRPVHTLYDGDTIFAVATGEVDANPVVLSELAAVVMARAVINGVLEALPVGGLPSARAISSGNVKLGGSGS